MKRKAHARLVLSEDILVEVLVRLPARSVARFRCVSKQWLSLASDPHFIRAHASLAPISGFFLQGFSLSAIRFSLNARRTFSLPDPLASSINFPHLPTLFDGSCSGLILCHRRRPDGRTLLCVCNPMTARAGAIFAGPDDHELIYFSLAVGLSTSPHFKVVGIGTDAEGKGRGMYIYSSEARSWKLLVRNICDGFSDMIYTSRSISWNGSLVWLGFKESLISLDVEREQLGRLPSPRPSAFRAYLVESRGRLHFIAKQMFSAKAATGYEFMTQFVISEMQPDCSGWCELYRVDLGAAMDVYPEVIRPVTDELLDIFSLSGLAMYVIWFLQGGEDQLLLSIPGKIISYHIRNQTFTQVSNNVPGPSGDVGGYDTYSWHACYPHVHTLFTL